MAGMIATGVTVARIGYGTGEIEMRAEDASGRAVVVRMTAGAAMAAGARLAYEGAAEAAAGEA